MQSIRTLSLIVLSMIVLSACGTQQNTTNTTTSNTTPPEAKIPVLEEEQIVQELPENFPENIPFVEGSSEADLHHDTDTNGGNMAFYITNMSVTEVYDFYVTALAEKGWTVTSHKQHNQDIAFVDFQKDGQLNNIYVSSSIPKIYPESLNLNGTFVAIRYNLEPLPNTID